MAQEGWMYRGYGLCVEDLEINSIERLKKLLELAPKYREEFRDFFIEKGILNPDIYDYLATDDNEEEHGFATIIKNALEEITGIRFVDCADLDGNAYILYEPQFQWMMNENERELTKEKLDEIFTKYISLITDTELEIDYITVVNF